MRFLLPAAALAAALTALLATATPADAARRIKLVDPRTAGQRQGNLVAVRGRADIHADPVFQGTDVDIVGSDGRIQFIGFIPRLNEYDFPQAAALNGKQVVMYGIVEIYLGMPATQLTFRDQLRPAPGT
jgi:hypothetical protein